MEVEKNDERMERKAKDRKIVCRVQENSDAKKNERIEGHKKELKY